MWFLGLLLAHLLPGTGSAGEENRLLGGSVVFQMELMSYYTLKDVNWLKSDTNQEPLQIATSKPGQPCQPNPSLPAFKGRVKVSNGCRRLEITNLTRGDSGTYRVEAETPFSKGNQYTETFGLQVYKGLSGADLTVECHTMENGNQQLNCSMWPWEDGVTLSWANNQKAELFRNSVVLELSGNETERDFTCTARNPASEASRMVPLKEVCSEKSRSPGNKTEEGPGGVSHRLLAVTVVVMLAAKVMISACVFAKWPRRPGKARERPDLAEGRATAQERSPRPPPPRPSPPEPVSSRQ